VSQACSFLSLGVDNLVISWWRQCRSAHACGSTGSGERLGFAEQIGHIPASVAEVAEVSGGIQRRGEEEAAHRRGSAGGMARKRGPTRAAMAMGRRANAGKVGAPRKYRLDDRSRGCNDRGTLSLHRGQTATPGTPHQSVGHNGLRGPLTTCGQFHPKKKSRAATGMRRHGGHPRPPASPCEGCGALRRRADLVVARQSVVRRGGVDRIELCDSRLFGSEGGLTAG